MGNGHIDTFDGKTYTLLGSCQYNLVEGTNSDASSKLRVMYTNNQNINTNELVIVHYGNTVTLKGSQIIVNGQAGPELPYKVNDLLIRQATSVLIGVEGSDFTIYFDGFRVYLTLQTSFLNQTRGLCGTFNFVTRDDYLTPNGLIETNLIGFADAYKISQTCTTPSQTSSCSLFPAVRDFESIGDENFMFFFFDFSRMKLLLEQHVKIFSKILFLLHVHLFSIHRFISNHVQLISVLIHHEIIFQRIPAIILQLTHMNVLIVVLSSIG